jgi:hypothetical protein
MLKFLRWFMKLFRPEKSGYVRNIQTSADKEKTGVRKSAKGKKAVFDTDRFFWIPTNKIVEIKKNSQGMTVEIHLASGTEITPLLYTGEFRQSAKKQGLSKVIHHLEFSLGEKDLLLAEADRIKSTGTNLSFLHVNRYGDGLFYGEEKGLSIMSLEKGRIVLEGTENNVFYEMTQECLQRLIPKTE